MSSSTDNLQLRNNYQFSALIQNCLIWSSNSSLVRLIKPPGAPSASPTRAQQIGNRMVVKFLSGFEFKVRHSKSSSFGNRYTLFFYFCQNYGKIVNPKPSTFCSSICRNIVQWKDIPFTYLLLKYKKIGYDQFCILLLVLLLMIIFLLEHEF